MARLRWTPQALEDIEAICTYIARDSDYYARIFAQQIIERVSTLESFPGAGRIVAESNREHVREILHENYRIVYRELAEAESTTISGSERKKRRQ